MFQDVEALKTIAPRRSIGEASAVAALEAYYRIGIESAVLSRRLFDHTQKLCLSASTHKDAKDVGRTLGTFVNASYRDIAQNAEAVFAIWRRFLRSACSDAAID